MIFEEDEVKHCSKKSDTFREVFSLEGCLLEESVVD